MQDYFSNKIKEYENKLNQVQVDLEQKLFEFHQLSGQKEVLLNVIKQTQGDLEHYLNPIPE